MTSHFTVSYTHTHYTHTTFTHSLQAHPVNWGQLRANVCLPYRRGGAN